MTRARKWIHRPKAQHRLRKIWSESGDKYVENWKEIFKAQLEIHLSTTHEQDHRACNTNWDWLARGASTEHCCYCLWRVSLFPDILNPGFVSPALHSEFYFLWLLLPAAERHELGFFFYTLMAIVLNCKLLSNNIEETPPWLMNI